jgi:hypothetical protein
MREVLKKNLFMINKKETQVHGATPDGPRRGKKISL